MKNSALLSSKGQSRKRRGTEKIMMGEMRWFGCGALWGYGIRERPFAVRPFPRNGILFMKNPALLSSEGRPYERRGTERIMMGEMG